MPRGQKSKLRAREKRRQARSETQCLQEAQALRAQEGETPSCSSLSGDAAPCSSAAGLPPKSQGAPPTPAIAGAPSHKKSGKGAKGKRPERATSSTATRSPASSEKDLLMNKAEMLMHYLLYRYQLQEPVRKGGMLKIIHKRFRQQFPEILKMAADQVDLLFGLELKEVKPGSGSYTLISKLDDRNSGSPMGGLDFPTNGLLMPLLGLIFLNGNSASEEEIWKFLSILKVYDGEEHLIFGEPRKLITKDLVKLGYLVYRQVPHSDPPRCEFLWGRRAHIETSKMKVLEFLAKINETIPSVFRFQYAEALRQEEERADTKATAKHGHTSLFT
ncbi:Melanoma-associated antigen B1 [Heterocephalus glaber]|uniref:Melanoma-associated antigen B1 n=1 Tax=Heterocephalus glaber TaxID=10181 RepID=G5BQK2_HETGA|nr:melanoma-associated antigen B1 [Heterocephalus glaber]EHB11563.1 Melanoma-associated antigen B1 [Heterocephalus glaber]